jgi:hypothetical protein
MLVQPAEQHWSTPVHAGPPRQDVEATQTAATQVSPGGQMLPQPPQLSGLVSMSVQPDAQHCSTPVHAAPPLHWTGLVQLPRTHVSFLGQATLHAPQLLGSVAVSVQPDAQHEARPVQATPPLHEGIASQTPAMHSSPVAQVIEQPPQWKGDTLVLTHVVPQHVSPAEQPAV